jgi:hypothetical protein
MTQPFFQRQAQRFGETVKQVGHANHLHDLRRFRIAESFADLGDTPCTTIRSSASPAPSGEDC